MLPWQPIKVNKLAFFADQSSLSHCHSETDCSIAIPISKRLNVMNFSALCTVLIRFGPSSNPRVIIPFCGGGDVDLLYRLGRPIGGDNYTDIRLAVAQQTLLWQPAKFGGCSQTSTGTTFTHCSGVGQQICRSWSRFKRLNGNNAKSCKKFGEHPPVILEVTLLKRAIFASIRP